MNRLLSYLKPHTGKVIIACFLVVFIVISELARPVIIGEAIDDDIVTGDFSGLINKAVLYFIMLLMGFLFNWLVNVVLQKVGQDIVYEIRRQTYEHIHGMNMRFFNEQPVGKLTTRVTNDSDAISELFANILIKLFKNGIKILGYVVVMLMINVRMALISFVTLPVVVLVTWVMRKYARKAYDDIRTRLTELNTYLSEHLMGMKLTQVFNMEPVEVRKFNARSGDLYRANQKEITAFAIFRPLIYLISVFALMFVIWTGAHGFFAGWVTLGTLFVFVTYINELYDPIQEMAEQFGTLQQAVASANKIFGILDENNEIVNTNAPIDVDFNGKIEFKNVWFSYVEGEYILKDVSFVIQPGEKVAFVGATGAGKSTILNLIGRYYDIDSGQILINGVDIRDIDIEKLRSAIGQVQQDVYLFTGDIRSNITLGREDITDHEVWEALRLACADGFVRTLPDSLYSEVTERGSTLSAGQRQLISFARTLLINPQILVLDEATASIDTETEQLITHAISNLMEGRTTIMVAHRLSTIKHADVIYVMGHGEIVEQGSHSELIDKDGVYRRLYELQKEDMS